MAYFKVLSVIKQYPELVVSNIYELDDYEASIIAQGASGHILEHIMFVSDIFKDNSSGLVTFGVKKPESISLLYQAWDTVKEEETPKQEELIESIQEGIEETKEIIEETNVLTEVVNPFYYADEESNNNSIELQYENRLKELNSLLARDLRELCERSNITYRNKTEAIQSILKLEFPDYKLSQEVS